MTKRLEITLDDETWARLDAARKFEPRAAFVKRALESALSGSALKGAPGEDARVSSDRLKSDDSSSASSRAPEEKEPPVAEVLGSPVRKAPSVRDTWAR